LGLSWTDAVAVVLSAIGVYLAFLVLIRIVRQRALAAMSSFDFAATIALGAIMGRAVLGYTPTLGAGVLGMATAPTTPSAISHTDPAARNAGSVTRRDPMSNTRLATQAPIGIVTSIGWNGSRPSTPPPIRDLVLQMAHENPRWGLSPHSPRPRLPSLRLPVRGQAARGALPRADVQHPARHMDITCWPACKGPRGHRREMPLNRRLSGL
jgi:hypothetical protein